MALAAVLALVSDGTPFSQERKWLASHRWEETGAHRRRTADRAQTASPNCRSARRPAVGMMSRTDGKALEGRAGVVFVGVPRARLYGEAASGLRLKQPKSACGESIRRRRPKRAPCHTDVRAKQNTIRIHVAVRLAEQPGRDTSSAHCGSSCPPRVSRRAELHDPLFVADAPPSLPTGGWRAISLLRNGVPSGGV
jgi:hypothetical protein